MNRRRTALFAFVAAIVFWAPFFANATDSGWGDWQWFHRQWEVARVSWLRYGEIPLWDSSQCGGSPLWGQPQNQVFSPLYLLLALPFGTVLGTKLWAIAHTFIGLYGAFWFFREEERLDRWPAAFAAMVWGLSGFFAWHGAGGHSTYFAFYYLPYLVLGWRRSMRDSRYAAMVAGVLAIALLEGAHYPVPFFILVLLFEGLRSLWVERTNLTGVVRGGAIGGGLALILGSFRLVPIALAIQDNPRDVPSTDVLSFDDVLEMLTAREHEWLFGGHRWAWAEYGTFIGWTPLVLGAIGILLLVWRWRRVDALLGTLLFGAATFGAFHELSPWTLLHSLPFFERLHVPARFAVIATFYFAPIAALPLEELEQRARRSVRRTPRLLLRGLMALLVLGATADILVVNLRTNDRWDHPPLSTESGEEHYGEGRYHLVDGRDYVHEYANYAHWNVGVRECYDATGWAVSRRLWVGPRPQARFFEGAGEVLDWDRSNRGAWAEIEVREGPALLAFNQNYDAGWVSSVGEPVDHQGLMAVRGLAPGRYRVELHFEPASFWPLVAVFAFGLLLMGLVVRGRGPRWLLG